MYRIRFIRPWCHIGDGESQIIQPGTYEVPTQISEKTAQLAVRLRRGVRVFDKIAPENKIVGCRESKRRLGLRTRDRGCDGSKFDRRGHTHMPDGPLDEWVEDTGSQ